jgi:hypothetical protein
VALTLEQRKAILDSEVTKQVQAGWRLASRTDTTATMVLEQKPSACLGIILLLLCIIPGVLYLMNTKNMSIYIEVDEEGQIKRTRT